MITLHNNVNSCTLSFCFCKFVFRGWFREKHLAKPDLLRWLCDVHFFLLTWVFLFTAQPATDTSCLSYVVFMSLDVMSDYMKTTEISDIQINIHYIIYLKTEVHVRLQLTPLPLICILKGALPVEMWNSKKQRQYEMCPVFCAFSEITSQISSCSNYDISYQNSTPQILIFFIL